MILESITLMVLGMSIVFAFLILLMLAVKFMGATLQGKSTGSNPPPTMPHVGTPSTTRKIAPAVSAIARKVGSSSAADLTSANDQGAVIAAISTAISMHRQQSSL